MMNKTKILARLQTEKAEVENVCRKLSDSPISLASYFDRTYGWALGIDTFFACQNEETPQEVWDFIAFLRNKGAIIGWM